MLLLLLKLVLSSGPLSLLSKVVLFSRPALAVQASLIEQGLLLLFFCCFFVVLDTQASPVEYALVVVQAIFLEQALVVPSVVLGGVVDVAVTLTRASLVKRVFVAVVVVVVTHSSLREQVLVIV